MMTTYKSIRAEDARTLVTQSLGQPYQEKPFRQLVSNILPNAEVLDSGAISGKYIPQGFSDHITSYKRVAKIRGYENIDALSVKLKTFGSMVNARAMQRRFIARYLNGAFNGKPKDAALVAFYVDGNPDWRFSLVYKEYTFDDSSAKTILSEPRRSSFLVGPHELTHTAEQQFVDLLQAEDRGTVERLSDAFSVEKVTKEFFGEYKKLFLDLQTTVQHSLETSQTVRKEFTRCGIEASVYAKRLLGQVVFLYFLQKKGWLGVPTGATWGRGSRTWLRELFNQHAVSRNFFSEILNPLFYEALATDRSTENHYYTPLSCRIPFLNGGLFEPVGGHDWQNTPVTLENEFFEKLFTIFDRYNFTIREDEPLESEVAVDPEMLGKVFEGLLDTSERRQSGAFYTPRHIVHYMCRESLIQYLDRRLNFSLEYVDAEQVLPGLTVNKQTTLPGLRIPGTPMVPRYIRRERLPLEEIRKFIRQDELPREAKSQADCKNKSDEYTDTHDRKLPTAVENYAQELDEALAGVKVCDPAIGSGAFAVGMMLEIIHARKVLHDTGTKKNCLLTPYELKRHTIGNSLYGVDIDASAVDIAKLRLWLSLVVDEDDYTQIKPLPNLDYKIMVGNSLDSWRTTNNILDSSNISGLEALRNHYFITTDHNEKIKLKYNISAIRQQCGTLGTFDWLIDFSDVLPTQKQSSTNKNRHFGFDIVIGNPPYIQLQTMSAEAKKLKSFYQSFSSMGDIYCLFYELGCKLLTPHGVLAFITSNSWMRAGYGEALRKFFAANTNPLRLIDFAGHKVFDSATVDVNIMILEKGKNTGQTGACTIKENCSTNLSDYIERNSTASRFETGDS
ncbi:MAG: Eco57I restriction-modification methylase domain-containing protein, partial [Desulfovibrionaceae bacterium]